MPALKFVESKNLANVLILVTFAPIKLLNGVTELTLAKIALTVLNKNMLHHLKLTHQSN